MTSSLIHLAVLAAASVAEDGAVPAANDVDQPATATADTSADERGSVCVSGTRLTMYGDRITVEATAGRSSDRARFVGAAKVMTWVVRRDAPATVIERGARRERSRVDALQHATRHAAGYARRLRAERTTSRTWVVIGRAAYARVEPPALRAS